VIDASCRQRGRVSKEQQPANRDDRYCDEDDGSLRQRRQLWCVPRGVVGGCAHVVPAASEAAGAALGRMRARPSSMEGGGQERARAQELGRRVRARAAGVGRVEGSTLHAQQ
jgi:hypothetical protein